MRRLRRAGWTLALGCAWVLFTSRASASGIPGARFGYEQGSVVAPNPTAIAYNPGALGFSGTQLFLDVSLGIRDFSWTHERSQGDAPEPPGFEGANYGRGHALTIGAGPQFGASFAFGKLVIGGGWFAPFGGGTLQFDRNERFANTQYPGAADGVTRWHGYRASSTVVYGAAGAALRLGPLALGATANLIYASFNVRRAQNSPIAGNDLTQEQRVAADTDGVYGSFALGAMLEVLADQLWLGASYQAQPGLGEMDLDGTYTLDPMIGVDGPKRTQQVTLHQGLPDVFRMGARFRPVPRLELRLTGDYTRWSFSQTQCLSVRDMPCTVRPDGSAATGSGVIKNLPRNWRDTLAVRAGASYWLVPALEVFVGLGFESAAIPDETLDPLLADAATFSGALGARVRLAETWFVAASYNHQHSAPRDNRGRSELANPEIQTTSRSVDGGGEYRQWFGIFNVNVAKTF